MRCPSWSGVVRAQVILSKTKFTGFLVSSLALLVAVKIRLAGTVEIADAIDGELLVFALISMLAAGVLGVLSSLLIWATCPPSILDHPTTDTYLDALRKQTFDASYFEKSYGAKLEAWRTMDRGGFWSATVATCLALCVACLLLSLALAISSFVDPVRAILQSSLQSWQNVPTPPKTNP